MTMNELIMKAREKKCSDIHISEGMPVSFRIHGQLLDSGFSFPAAETREMILSMLSRFCNMFETFLSNLSHTLLTSTWFLCIRNSIGIYEEAF